MGTHTSMRDGASVTSPPFERETRSVTSPLQGDVLSPDFGTNSWMRRTVLVDAKHRIREHCWSRRLTDAPTLQAFSTRSCHANGRVEDVIRYESLSARPPSIHPGVDRLGVGDTEDQPFGVLRVTFGYLRVLRRL